MRKCVALFIFLAGVLCLTAASPAASPARNSKPSIAKLSDYSQFAKYWKAHPSERVALFVRYPDWGYRWMTELPGNITKEWQEDPKGLCEILNMRPLLIRIWMEDDRGTALGWMASEDCHECLKARPLLLSKLDDATSSDLLFRYPDTFVIYYKADPVLARGWATRNPEVFKLLYEGNDSIRVFAEQTPELRQLLPQEE